MTTNQGNGIEDLIQGPAKRIKEFREQRGWSQRELARQIEVSQTTISEVESGQRPPSISVLRGLMNVFGPDVVDYVLDTPEKKESDGRAEVLLQLFEELPSDYKDLALEQVKLLHKRAKKE